MDRERKPAAAVDVPIPVEEFADPVEQDVAPHEGLDSSGTDEPKADVRPDLESGNRFRDSLDHPIRVPGAWFESSQLSRSERLAEMRAMMGHAGD